MDWVKAAPAAAGGRTAFQVYAGFLAAQSLAEKLCPRTAGLWHGRGRREGSYTGARSPTGSIFRCPSHNTKGQVFLLPIFRGEARLALAGGSVIVGWLLTKRFEGSIPSQSTY